MREAFVKERQTRDLRCVLTDAEVAIRAGECALKIAQMDEVEEGKKAAASDFKEQLEALHLEVRRLSRQVREHAEERPVECELWIRPEVDRAEMVRTDTGEVLYSRPLEKSEKQGLLFPVGRDASAQA